MARGQLREGPRQEAADRAANREARRVYTAAYRASQKDATRLHAREAIGVPRRNAKYAEPCRPARVPFFSKSRRWRLV